MRFKAMLFGGLAVTLSGCTAVDPGFSEAVRYDMAIQTVNPDPVYAEVSTQPGYHGEKAQKATERYRKGATKPVTTQSIGGGGASGVGGGSTPGS